MTWESFQLILTDHTTSITTLDSDNTFRNFTSCAATSDNSIDLEPGEMVFAGNFNTLFHTTDPTGHNFTATFTFCSENGGAGTCIERSITFTP
jgi:hypothetical protein